jgi:CBS domain containing-hemolysin-like protein
MTATEAWLITALVILIAAAAMLGAAEAALLRVRRVRLEIAADSGDHRSGVMVELLDDLPRVLNTVLLVVLLVQIGAATIAGALAARLFGSVGVTIASIVLTFVLFVYSEAIPKTFAVRHPESVARATAPLLRFLSRLFRPLVSVLVGFADLQAPGTGIVSPTALTEEELLRLAADAVALGSIDESDHVLIDRAFELGDQRVDDVFVPRLDVVAIPDTASVREALDIAIANGHRRIPVYSDDIDSVVGVVRLRDLARAALENGDTLVSSVVSEPLIVPESRKVIELLGDMQASDNHFAVVVDEFGGTAGIVTIEDIVGRLFVSFTDQGEQSSSGIEMIDSVTWIVQGTADTDDVERATGTAVPRGEWTTVAGLVTALAGHFPIPGETVETDDLQFTVTEASAHRILRVQVTLR